MATRPNTDEELQQAVEAFEQHGEKTKAAKALGLPRNTFNHRLKVAKMRGIGSWETTLNTLHGHNPEYDLTHTVPSPLILRGTSSLYKDGKLALQWVKTKLDDHKVEEALRVAVEELANGIPRVEKSTPPTHTLASLCNLYTLTDCHIGMRAWAPEAGEDWDLDIAEKTLCDAIDYLVDASPPAEMGIVNQLGDFLHFDSLSPTTPLHGNLLDVDSRYSKVVRVAVRILRYAVTRALQRHSRVIVLISEGNHDLASSVWLRHLFGLLYENEDRVDVHDSERPYFVHVHGKTMLAFHHGHMVKNAQLPLLFATQHAKEWGACTKRYCHTGHRHHVDEKEHPGMKVTQHATLAVKDAYAARNGYLSERQMLAITYHAEYGQVATTTVVPEMLN